MTTLPVDSLDLTTTPAATPERLGSGVTGRWPWVGIAAGVAAAAAPMLHHGFIDDPAVYEAGPEAVYAALGGQLVTQLGAASGYLATVLLVPFGLGLVRMLRHRLPGRDEAVAAVGVLLAVGVATLVGGFGMKSVLASGLPGHMDNTFYTQVDVAVISTIAGQLQYAMFLPVVAAAGTFGVLVLRERAMQRWVGLFSVVAATAVAGVTVVLNLPYSAGLVTPLWLVAVSVAALRLRRHEG